MKVFGTGARVCLLVACGSLNTGCAAILKGSTSSMSIEGLPRGAEIETLDGIHVRRESQNSVRVSAVDPPRALRITARTYQVPASRFVGVGWVLLDVCMGLVPVIVDAASGSWYEYEDVSLPHPKTDEELAAP